MQKSDKTYSDFDKYHSEYMPTGDVPSHKDIWTIILDADLEDVIWYGWHRFHYYVEKKISDIPAVLPMFNKKCA